MPVIPVFIMIDWSVSHRNMLVVNVENNINIIAGKYPEKHIERGHENLFPNAKTSRMFIPLKLLNLEKKLKSKRVLE